MLSTSMYLLSKTVASLSVPRQKTVLSPATKGTYRGTLILPDSNCGILLSLLLKLLLIKDPYIHKLSILIIVLLYSDKPSFKY